MILPLTIALFLAPECTMPDAEGRRATYQAIRSTCAEQGVSPDVCVAAQAIAWRESRGNPCARHTRGKGEDGIGPFGHAPKFWGWTLRATGLGREAFTDVRLATLALFREQQYAVRRGAENLRDLQRVHSGRPPRDESRPRRDNAWCYLLRHGPRDDQHVIQWSGLDCLAEVTLDDLGPRLDDARMVSLAEKGGRDGL